MEYISAVTRREAGIHPERVHTVTCGGTLQNPVFMLWDYRTQGKRWNHWNHLEVCKYGVQAPFLRARLALPSVSHSKPRVVNVGQQGCPLSPVLFMCFMDENSRYSQGLERVHFGNHRVSPLLFAGDAALLASSSWDLRHVLRWFSAKCEAAGMQISPSKSGLSYPGWLRGPASSGDIQ